MLLNILHLEDSEKDAEFVRALLEEDGCECRITRTETREEFVQELEHHTFDFILADYNLPTFDGMSALEVARGISPETPFILISGTLGEEQGVEAVKQGAADYLLKQNLVRLVPAVRSALQHADEARQIKQAEELVRQQSQDLALINRLNQVLNRGHSVVDFAGMLSDELRRTFAANPSNLLLCDEKKRHLVMQGLHLPGKVTNAIEHLLGISIPSIVLPVEGVSLYARVIKEKKSLLTNDPDAIQGMIAEYASNVPLPEALRHTIRQLVPTIHRLLGNQGVIIVPLLAGNELIGLLEVARPTPWSDEDLRRIETIGSQLTSAILRKQAEEALLKSEERYRGIVDSISDGIAEVDATGVITFANNALAHIHGYEIADELIGMTMNDLVPPNARDEVVRGFVDSLFGKNMPANIVFPFLRKDGSTGYGEVRPTPITVDGKIIGMRIVLRDTTERKLSEEKLRQSEEEFRLIAENVADMIEVLDLDGKRLYNSPSYKNVLGEPASLRGTDVLHDIVAEDREKVKAMIRDTVTTGVVKRAEYRLLSPDGRIHQVESQASVIRDAQDNASRIVVVSRDITEKKLLQEQLLRSQRLESLGTLAGGIAHDLNNVLAPILLSIETLKMSANANSLRMLDTLERSVHRGSSIVHQVLSFARGIEGERAPLQIRAVINDTIAMVRQSFPKSISVKVDIPMDIWTTIGDATQLHQVLMNLCVNARDAMPGGGTLSLSAENKVVDEQYARMHIEAKPGRYVTVVAQDTGTGMPPEVSDHIFEPFFTTKGPGKGTGLGLSTVHSIVKGHGGFINVYSEMGKGTAIRVYLPASLSADAIATATEKEPLPTGHGEVILVVDDEASILQITKQTLEAFGYEALTASDGTEAIALYATRSREIALVLTDMMMPFMDGARTIRALRKINASVKIVACSGLTTNDHGASDVNETADAFIAKPYTAEKLLKSIHQVLHGHTA